MRGISAPVYLQYHHGDSILPANKWPYGIASVPGLVSRQKYHVVVEMTVPRSKTNLEVGNWMIGIEMRGIGSGGLSDGVKGLLGWDEEWDATTTQKLETESPTVLARSKRPAILTYRSPAIEHAHRLLRLPFYLLGWHTESEHISISMLESVEFDKGPRNIPTSVKVELRSRHPLDVYTASVRFSARLEGLRWLMYRYWLSSAIAFTLLFWSVEMGVLLFTWGVFTLLFSSSKSTPTAVIKQEERSRIKQEDGSEPGTPMSNTSRTFPTLASQPPLHYSSPSPKTEANEPALEDIPMREDAEADDEDDGFVLEDEPVPSAVENAGLFTDSGIGTSMESSFDRDRGLNRRRSGRGRDGSGSNQTR